MVYIYIFGKKENRLNCFVYDVASKAVSFRINKRNKMGYIYIYKKESLYKKLNLSKFINKNYLLNLLYIRIIHI